MLLASYLQVLLLNPLQGQFISKNKPFTPFYFSGLNDIVYLHRIKQKTMNQTVIIRKETPEDYDRVIELTEKAFEALEISDHNEGKLVDKLRKAPTFVEEFSLVAELNE